MSSRQDCVSAPYTAQVIVSPACLGGETKDQDRAAWHAATATACVADGVSSAPYSQSGAELATRLAPTLFQRPTDEAMDALAQGLFELREQVRAVEPVLPADISPALRPLLAQAAEAKLEKACQTTLIAARLGAGDDELLVDVVRCGDSALLAYAPDGRLLGASLPAGLPTTDGAGTTQPPNPDAFRFGPEEVLVVRIVGPAQELPLLLPEQSQPAQGDLVCVAVEVPRVPSPRKVVGDALWLVRGQLLLVPSRLVTRCRDPKFGGYLRVPVSAQVRPLSAPVAPRVVSFAGRGAATAVLPDDVSTGQWTSERQTYPAEAQFVLASDGFTGCFADSTELWAWLQAHAEHLSDEQACDEALAALHALRYERIGDDDISFVWVAPQPRAGGQTPMAEDSR